MAISRCSWRRNSSTVIPMYEIYAVKSFQWPIQRRVWTKIKTFLVGSFNPMHLVFARAIRNEKYLS